jgi:hypothetical protein
MLTKMTNWLRGTRRGDTLIREIEAARQDAENVAGEREKARARLDAVRDERKAKEPALTKAFNAAEAEIVRLETACQAAVRKQQEHRGKALAALASLDAAEQRELAILRMTASELIDDFLIELLDQQAATNAKSESYAGRLADGQTTCWHSNWTLCKGRAEAIVKARDLARQLAIEIFDDDDALAARLAEIRATIPPLDSLSKLSLVA